MKLVIHTDDAAVLHAGIERGETQSVRAGEPDENNRPCFILQVGDTELPALAVRTPEDAGSLVIETTAGDVIVEGESD